MIMQSIVSGQTNPQNLESHQQRVAWFTEARPGMFIHWSAGAVEGARWHGEPLRNPVPYGEWLRCRNRVPRADYDKLIAQMSITKEEVNNWVALARDAGMKYIVFVAKHHDGLAYWPSEVSDYTYQNLTGSNLDVIQLLKNACDTYGLKLGFYYSHWQDWEHPYGWGNFWDYESDPAVYQDIEWHDLLYSGILFRPSLKPEQFDQYWNEKSLPQVRELIEKYDPAILWFDMYAPLEATNVSEKQVNQLLSMIRELSPECLINSRLGISDVGPDGVDFETMGDNYLATETIGHPWESAVTLNRSWGFNRDDTDWKPATYFIRALAANISRGGNLLINIGPRGDGTLPVETENIMNQIGTCIKENKGKGFYNCGASPFSDDMQDWGLVTHHSDPDKDHFIYLHVFDWPLDGIIRLNGLETGIRKAMLASDERELPVDQPGLLARIQGPGKPPVGYDTVVELELDAPPIVDNSFIGEKNLGGYYLPAEKARVSGLQINPKADGGWIPPHLDQWQSDNASATWKIYIPESSDRKLTICYACAIGKEDQDYNVIVNGNVRLNGVTQATHPEWKEYRAFDLGTLSFEKPGFYEITIHPESQVKEELFHLAWLHLE